MVRNTIDVGCSQATDLVLWYDCMYVWIVMHVGYVLCPVRPAIPRWKRSPVQSVSFSVTRLSVKLRDLHIPKEVFSSTEGKTPGIQLILSVAEIKLRSSTL